MSSYFHPSQAIIIILMLNTKTNEEGEHGEVIVL